MRETEREGKGRKETSDGSGTQNLARGKENGSLIASDIQYT